MADTPEREPDDEAAPAPGFYLQGRQLRSTLRRPTLELASGRVVVLDRIVQYRTYDGLLLGLPHAALNRRRVDDARQEAERLLDRGPVLVLTPVERPIAVPAPADEAQRRLLAARPPCDIPHVTCITVWDSNEPVRGGSGSGSWLKVVHFQDQLAPPFDPATLARLRAVDWDALAADYEA